MYRNFKLFYRYKADYPNGLVALRILINRDAESINGDSVRDSSQHLRTNGVTFWNYLMDCERPYAGTTTLNSDYFGNFELIDFLMGFLHFTFVDYKRMTGSSGEWLRISIEFWLWKFIDLLRNLFHYKY